MYCTLFFPGGVEGYCTVLYCTAEEGLVVGSHHVRHTAVPVEAAKKVLVGVMFPEITSLNSGV
jgi:hypothetical protein